MPHPIELNSRSGHGLHDVSLENIGDFPELSWLIYKTIYQSAVVGQGNGYIKWTVDSFKIRKGDQDERFAQLHLVNDIRETTMSCFIQGREVGLPSHFTDKIWELYNGAIPTRDSIEVVGDHDITKLSKKHRRRYFHFKRMKQKVIDKYPQYFL